MLKKYAVLAAFSLLSQGAFAQLKYLNLNMGVNGGYGQLLHKTDFQSTPLEALYDFIIDLPQTKDLTWQEFLDGYDIKDRFWQPRMGFSAMLTYRDWPIKAIGEATSSTSSYTRVSYAVTMGLGKDIYIADSTWYFSFLGGYKLVLKDYGFGANTIVNSVGRKESREDLAQFFGPQGSPIGRPSGDLFTVRLGFARTLDWYYRWSAGVEAYYELDLTDKLVRNSRMTTYGAQVFVRFKIFGKNMEPVSIYTGQGGSRKY
jgi:hypothetical protein